MKKKHKKLLLFVGIPVVVIALFVWNTSLQKDRPLTFFKDTNVACLVNGHQQLAIHVHPIVTISVDGEQEQLPANIGIEGPCMSEIHTHDGTGTLHVETFTRDRFDGLSFTDFFTVWGQSLEREGYTLTIMVDGVAVASADDVPFEDGARIDLIYTSQS